VAREWQLLHDALNLVARVRAEQGDAAAFRTHAATGHGRRLAVHRAPDADGAAGKVQTLAWTATT
jgi:hypothetical protein